MAFWCDHQKEILKSFVRACYFIIQLIVNVWCIAKLWRWHDHYNSVKVITYEGRIFKAYFREILWFARIIFLKILYSSSNRVPRNLRHLYPSQNNIRLLVSKLCFYDPRLWQRQNAVFLLTILRTSWLSLKFS